MWIKVCGIRDCQTARQVAELEINAIGLNFYSRSPRLVVPEIAKEISQTLPSNIARVGVFVNHTIDEVESLATECRLEILQLHGDESATYCAALQKRLPDLRLIRA
jgi:phosphoribosylanthranilate isomerase